MAEPLPRPAVILASTSRYRAQLLRRLFPIFAQESPEIIETELADEATEGRALRLAQAKATAMAARHPGSIVIGSDQVASLDGAILHKPGDLDTARTQLTHSSGREVVFRTSVCVIDSQASAHAALDTTTVRFRALDATTIERYLAAENVLDCAGSFKCEGLGITLFERIRSDDPTALVGLPLIATARLLRACGLRLP